MQRDIIIRTEPHQLTAFQVLGVMLDAMRKNRGVRCWLVIPKGSDENWKYRIRVVLAKQRKKISLEARNQQRELKESIFARLFSLKFSDESIPVHQKETAVLVMYHETPAQKRGRAYAEYMHNQGVI